MLFSIGDLVQLKTLISPLDIDWIYGLYEGDNEYPSLPIGKVGEIIDKVIDGYNEYYVLYKELDVEDYYWFKENHIKLAEFNGSRWWI